MDLDLYFDRISYAGPREADAATLAALMRAHVAAIPFENLDVQLGRPIGTTPTQIFDKLVVRRRGGWCYEQNGMLAWVLEALGFAVTRLAGGVMRVARGDDSLGGHLALLVRAEGRDWLVDVGFGGSLAEPIPLENASHDHAPYRLSLAAQDDGFWRYEEELDGKTFSFDFRAAPADPALLARIQDKLQKDPGSPFVQNLVVQRRLGERHLSLRGRVLVLSDAAGAHESLLDGPDMLVATLRDRFDLDLPEAASLWPRIAARHAALFGA